MRVTESLRTTIGRVGQREPQNAIRVDKEDGHLQRRLGNVLLEVVHVLRRPQSLRHDRANAHNAVVECPKRITVLILRVWPYSREKSPRDSVDEEERA